MAAAVATLPRSYTEEVGGDLMTDEEHIVIPVLVDRAALLAATLHKLGAGAWGNRGG